MRRRRDFRSAPGCARPVRLRLRCLMPTGEVEFAEPESGVSPGQACVFYKSLDPRARVLGGGFIAAS